MKEEIKSGYFVDFSDEYEKAELIKVRFFSKENLAPCNAMARKYLDEISTRRYYKDGRKQWFYRVAWMYEVFIPKNKLKLNAEKTEHSYIAFDVVDTGITLINNTSAMSAISFQSTSIHHCLFVGKREALKLLSIAVDMNKSTVFQSENKIAFNGNYPLIMFIAKYATSHTNFTKATYSFSRYQKTSNDFVNFILRNGLTEESLDYIRNYVDSYEKEIRELSNDEQKIKNAVEKIKDKYLLMKGKEILEDIQKWQSQSISFYGLPVELETALKTIKHY